MMQITLTLSDVLNRCNDWGAFCSDKGWSEWCVNEGGGDIIVTLSEEEAAKYGIGVIVSQKNNSSGSLDAEPSHCRTCGAKLTEKYLDRLGKTVPYCRECGESHE